MHTFRLAGLFETFPGAGLRRRNHFEREPNSPVLLDVLDDCLERLLYERGFIELYLLRRRFHTFFELGGSADRDASFLGHGPVDIAALPDWQTKCETAKDFV